MKQIEATVTPRPAGSTSARHELGRALGKTVLARHWPISLLVALGLVIILLVGDDFGPSWDEWANAKIGAAALRAYMGDPEYFTLPAQADHGPFYFMLYAAGSKALGVFLPSWRLVDRRHILNAMSLLVGLCALYAICLRYLAKGAATAITWLFAAQPLIFGQGFVNQKDIPFMSFFAASVALGLYAADAWGYPRPSGKPQAKEEMNAHPTSSLRLGVAIVTVVLAVLWWVDWWGVGWTQQVALGTLSRVYSGEIGGWLRNMFLLVATDSYKTPLTLYLGKARELFFWLRVLLTPMWLALVLWTWYMASRRVREVIRTWIAGPYPLLILAGVTLGCTISIRQYGILAGCLAGVLFVVNGRRRSILPLALYGLTAAVATYVTWPFLWANPVNGFLHSLGRASGYGAWMVLFRGQIIDARVLPWDYVPGMTVLELTEPAVLLFLIGCGVLIWRARKGEGRAIDQGLLLVWLVLPVVAIHVLGGTIYDNIRHVLFLLPPIFVIAGYGIEWLLSRLPSRWLRGALVGLLLLPGLVAAIRLHPYESSYFNSLAGGLTGAADEYFVDPLCLSYREATRMLNGIAEPGAVVSVYGPSTNVVPFAREDLRIVSFRRRSEAAYLMTCKRTLFVQFAGEGFVVRAEVVRDGAALARILERAPTE